jgi:pilus assembly protein TadC
VSATAAVLAGLAGHAALRRRVGTIPAAVAGCAAGLLLVAPLLAATSAAAGAMLLVRHRMRIRRLDHEAAEADVGLLADLMALGLRAGLSLVQALRYAVPHVAGGLAAEVEDVLRCAGRSGTEAALAGAGGRAGRLYRLAARAAATGAPLADAVEAFAAERRHADHTRAVEAARRLPVRMLVPLALLILPGFVILAVGPALLEAVGRLRLAP